MNLVGVLPGQAWGTSADQVLVLTASWDLGLPNTGDLGSGLAALLEVARVLMEDSSFRPRYSVLFIALDKEQREKEGSRAFVAEYLKPHIVDRFNCSVQVN